MQRTHKGHYQREFKPVIRISAAVCVCLLFSGPVIATDLPSPFLATYDVHHSGARVGLTTIALTANGEQTDALQNSAADLAEPAVNSANHSYNFSSITHPKGLAKFVRSRPVEEQSHFKWTAGDTLQPLSYTFKDGSRNGKRNNDIEFDWPHHIATSHYKNRDVKLELTEPVIDRLSLQVLLMRDLMNNSLKQSYKIANKNEIKTYEIEFLGEEVIDTNAGRFNTVKILQGRNGSSRFTHIWASKDHQYALVQLTQFKDNKPQTVLSLNTIEIESTRPAPPDPDGISYIPSGSSD